VIVLLAVSVVNAPELGVVEPMVPGTAQVLPVREEALIVPDPEYVSDAPVPTTIAAVVLVPEVRPEKDTVGVGHPDPPVWQKPVESIPSRRSALRLVTLVVLATINGAVPVETVEVNCPVKLRVLPAKAVVPEVPIAPKPVMELALEAAVIFPIPEIVWLAPVTVPARLTAPSESVPAEAEMVCVPVPVANVSPDPAPVEVMPVVPARVRLPERAVVAFLIVAVPVVAPIVRPVAAPAKLTVVAVVLRRSKLAPPATIEVLTVGEVLMTTLPDPVIAFETKFLLPFVKTA